MEPVPSKCIPVSRQKINDLKNTVYFTKPRLVAYFDYNHGKITKAKRMNYFINPKRDQYPMDLNEHFERYVRRESEMNSQHIRLSLKYDMLNAAEGAFDDNLEKTKVITRRGTLAAIMESYYVKYRCDLLTLRISRYKNNLYIIKAELDELNTVNMVESHHTQFLKKLFADSPNGTPNVDEPCDENIMLVAVHRSNLGKYDIVYSGEVQGIIDNEIINDFDDLDNITDRRFVLAKQMWKTAKNNDNKYLRYWMQSYLGNVRDIYIGYKSESGIVNEPIQHYLVKDLPKNRYWKPQVCMKFLHEFLQSVEKVMSSVNCPDTVYDFRYNPKKCYFMYDVFTGKTEKSFITDDYIKFNQQHFNN